MHPLQNKFRESETLSIACNECIHSLLAQWKDVEEDYKVIPLRQVKIALFPLLVSLRKDEIAEPQAVKLADVLDSIMVKDFQKAKQNYLTLSIGKGKFPIGLQNVGIHERKIKQTDNEHKLVLEDWCVNVKRLVNFMEWSNMRS